MLRDQAGHGKQQVKHADPGKARASVAEYGVIDSKNEGGSQRVALRTPSSTAEIQGIRKRPLRHTQ